MFGLLVVSFVSFRLELSGMFARMYQAPVELEIKVFSSRLNIKTSQFVGPEGPSRRRLFP